MPLQAIPGDRFELSSTLPASLRIGLGAVGTFIAFMIAKDLWRGLWPVSVVTPFFLLLFGGGLFIGLGLVVAMIWGPDENWVIAKGRFTVTRSLRSFRSEKSYNTAEIHGVEVTTTTWDSGLDTYSLEITLTTSEILRSPGFKGKADAESARKLLMGNRA